MIPRMTTIGTLKGYRYNLNRSGFNMSNSMNKVLTGRNFNTYAEDPALATRCFQLRRSYLRTSSQLTVNESVARKYDVAWKASAEISLDIDTVSNDNTFTSLLRGISDSTASGRNALGQSMVAKAKNIAQIMNGRYGENYIFSGADTLNVPFTWETRTNPDYIDPALAAKDPTNPDYAAAFQYLGVGGVPTNNIDEAERVAKINPDADLTQPNGPGNEYYLNVNGEPVEDAADAEIVPNENPAYNENSAYKYLKIDGTGTNDEKRADMTLYYRGVPVDSMDPADQEKLRYFTQDEKKYVDIGLGYKEVDGEVVGSSVSNVALQGIYYLGGYGTTEKEITLTDADGSSRTVKADVPNNIVSVTYRMGQILQNCDADSGKFASDAERDEFMVLAHQFEDVSSKVKQRYAELDTEASFLHDNVDQLTDTAESLEQQFLALEDADPAAAISEYMFAKYCYDTALKVGNSVLSQSLMDYMNF